MSRRIVIIWPETGPACELAEALTRTELGFELETIEAYPSSWEELEKIIGRDGQTKVIVVGLTDRRRATELLEVLHVQRREILTIAADRVESSDALRAALRAGAGDFWSPPFQVDSLRETLRELDSPEGGAGRDGQATAFIPCHAGDGASTVALHIAYFLSRQIQEQVLLADLDFQCGTTGFRLGLKPEYTLLDALLHADGLDDLWPKLALDWKGLATLAGPDYGTTFPDSNLVRIPGLLLSARRNFDWIIADLPAALYRSSEELLLTAHSVCLVCTPELISLHMARRRVNDLLELGVNREHLRLIVNRSDSRNSIAAGELEKAVGIEPYAMLANDYATVTEAAVRGAVVPAESKLGAQYQKLAVRLCGVQTKPKRSASTTWRKILKLG